MAKVVFNVQDQFLNQARKERVPIIITLIDNVRMEGHVKSFDPFCRSCSRPISPSSSTSTPWRASSRPR